MKKTLTIARYITIYILLLCNTGVVSAKPMEAPSLPASFEAACKSQLIVEAEYTGYSEKTLSEPVGYLNGPIAVFKVLRVIKGNYNQTEIEIKYDFHDGSACVPLEGWIFKGEEVMPQLHSKWLLLLNDPTNQIYRTYRGDFGRISIGSASEQFLDACHKLEITAK